MTKETWKTVNHPIWKEFYEVSDRGRVRSLPRTVWQRSPQGAWCQKTLRPVLLKQRPNRRGHLRVMLSLQLHALRPSDVALDKGLSLSQPNQRLRWHAYVHTLVAGAFLGGRPSHSLLVCHLDDNKRNNHMSNLVYGTRADNAQHALRNGCHGTERGRRKRKA